MVSEINRWTRTWCRNPKTPGRVAAGMNWGVTTELQLVAYVVVTALIRLAVDGTTIVCFVSTRVEVAKTEMKINIWFSPLSTIASLTIFHCPYQIHCWPFFIISKHSPWQNFWLDESIHYYFCNNFSSNFKDIAK